MKENAICKTCSKEFEREIRVSIKKKPQIYCSIKCRGQLGGRKKLTEEQKLEGLKKSFEKNVIRKEGCWDWKGRFFNTGYPIMTCLHNMGCQTAHRASWLIHKGPIPKDMCVCHNCPEGDNKRCSNPDHLFLGTSSENSKDMVKKGRQAKGEKNGSSKLKESDVKNIKIMLKKYFPCNLIAKMYSVSVTTISYIKIGRLWKHVEV